MKYRRFDELPVWQDSILLALRIFELTARSEFRGYHSLKEQLERAGVSVSNNIAEGFERGTTQELITFLYIARGSAGEVRSLTHLLERLPNHKTMRSEISDLRSQAVSISRQLHGWLTSLQNTDIKGHRYLNETRA